MSYTLPPARPLPAEPFNSCKSSGEAGGVRFEAVLLAGFKIVPGVPLMIGTADRLSPFDRGTGLCCRLSSDASADLTQTMEQRLRSWILVSIQC